MGSTKILSFSLNTHKNRKSNFTIFHFGGEFIKLKIELRKVLFDNYKFLLQPDITAPGLNISAAWSPVSTRSTGEQSVDFNIISGTSKSCPHVSAVPAIIKSVHPSSSPAAIKSAIMTTGKLFL